jgi:Flp pilus assembly protein TadG
MYRLQHSMATVLDLRHSRGTAFARRLREETGSALIEMAVVLWLLGIPLLLGTIYSAVLLSDYIEITNAAHAGAIYAMRSSTFAEDSPGIVAAAQADASHVGPTLAVTSSVYYTCSDSQDGTQYATQAAANAACTGASTHTLEFVQVVASAPITPPATFPGMPKTMTLSSTSAMEVEE